MSDRVRRLVILHGTDTQRQSFTPLEGELVYTTDRKELWAGDGATLGGVGPYCGLSAITDALIDDAQSGTSTTYSSSKIAELLAALPDAGGGGHVIQDEGVGLTQRAALDFVGTAVSLTDDAANDKTIVAINSLGGAISDWQDAGTISISATTTAPTKGSTTVDKVRWRRVGDSAEIEYEYVQSTAGVNGSGTYLFSLPSDLVADLTKIGNSSYPQAVVGHGYVYYDLGSGADSRPVSAFLTNNRTLFLAYSDTSTLDHSPIGSGNYRVALANYKLTFRVVVPIVGWSSNVQLASAATEYAYNTDTGSADCVDDLHYGYGAAGNLIGNSGGVHIKRKVRFKTPIQATDLVVPEVDPLGDGRWMPLPARTDTGILIVCYGEASDGSAKEGFGAIGSVNSTDLVVWFGSIPIRGNTWSGCPNARWRIRKSSGASMAEIPTDVCSQVKATLSTNMSLSSTLALMPFNTESKDATGEFNPSTGIFTANRAKRVLAHIKTFGSAAHTLAIAKNSVTNNTDEFCAVNRGDGYHVGQLTGVFDLAVGDTISFYAYGSGSVWYERTVMSITELPARRLV